MKYQKRKNKDFERLDGNLAESDSHMAKNKQRSQRAKHFTQKITLSDICVRVRK